MTMHSLDQILEQYKHSADYKRGVTYFEDAHVGVIQLDEHGKMIRADVDGSNNQTYSVDIRFAPAKHKLGVPILRGFCNCPVGFNCKHVFATLLTTLDEFDDSEINQILPMGFDSYEGQPSDLGADASKSMSLGMATAGSAPAMATTAPDGKQTDLQLHSQEGQETIEGNRVFYILEADPETPQLEIHVGSFSAQPLVQLMQPVNIQGILSSRGRIPPFANENDRVILQFAHHHSLLNANKRKSSIRIMGEPGAQILQAASKTNRLFMRDKRQLRQLSPIPDETVQLDWEFNHKYQARVRASLPAQNILVHPLPTHPPMFAYLPSVNPKETKNGCIGQLQNLSHEEVISLRAQDWVYLSKTDDGYTLDTSLIDQSLMKLVKPLPKITTQEISPEAHMKVKPIKLANGQTFEILEPLFQYGHHVVSGFSTLNSILNYASKKVTFIQRDKAFEQKFMGPLEEKMRSAHQDYYLFNMEYPQTKAFWFGNSDAKDYKKKWIQFLSYDIPQLEALGARFDISEKIKFKFETIDDDSWFMDLEPEDQGQWFDLSLGFSVDNKNIDLIKVLLEHLGELPSLDELAKAEDGAKIPIEFETGRFVFIEAKRLSKIIGTFYELLEPGTKTKKPKLNNYHASMLQNFANDLGEENIEWRGSKKIQALGEMLNQQGAIEPKKPSKNLQATLRGYQEYGLSWMQFLSDFDLNGILADDMGLGKTLQTLSHIQVHIEKEKKVKREEPLGPCLIVAPTSVVSNWIKEAAHFTPNLNITEYYGLNRKSINIKKYDVVVTSYGVLRQDAEMFAQSNLHFIILDEAQAIKNPSSKTATAAKEIPAMHKLCLTGTPIENHLGELWSMFDFLMPGFLGSARRFNKNFRKPIETGGDADQAKRLQARIAPFILRRTKDVVAKDLPPKTEMIHRSQLTGIQKDLYETVRLSVSDTVREAIRKNGLAQSQIVILDAILKLRQICCHPALLSLPEAQNINQSSKLEDLMELVEPLVEEGRSMLIFSSFASMLDIIAKRLDKEKIKYFKLTGKTRNRQALVDAFQAGERPVFLISLKAGGTGLTLTQADTVIHYDPWWNPAVEDQATDRAYRIGQDKPVFVYKMTTESTIEEKMLSLKERKKSIAESIYSTSGDQARGLHFTLDDIDDLFAPI
ncbi:MAG: DEAD/DEAH box helicase [Pseudomonadota bacterium]|nr:DEAD/DEAH box helicase [Pseudomonadota bacterium]